MNYGTEQDSEVHGKQPRGKGRWMFMMGCDGAWTEQAFNGSYAQAKKQALAMARHMNCDSIELLP